MINALFLGVKVRFFAYIGQSSTNTQEQIICPFFSSMNKLKSSLFSYKQPVEGAIGVCASIYD